jgi:molybdate transport system substrate-binding protein
MTGPTLDIFTAGATREGIAALAPSFAQASGIALNIATDHSHAILAQVLAGETDSDVVMLPEAMVARLDEAGLADPAIRARIGAVRVGAAVRAGRALPDVSTMDAMVAAARGAKSIVITTAPSGPHMDALFARLGLAGELGGRIARYGSGEEVNEHLLRSDAPDEIAFGVATEIRFYRGKGIAYAGPLPDEAQMVNVYQATLLKRSARRDEARALMDFLSTDEARNGFAPTGVEP